MNRYSLAAALFVVAGFLWLLPGNNDVAGLLGVAAFLIAVMPSTRKVEVEQRGWWRRALARWRDEYL